MSTRVPLSVGGLLGLAALLSSCNKSTFRPPERAGPPALVQQEEQSRFWLVLKQEEQRVRYVGSIRFSGDWVTDTYYHFDLQAHDPATTERLWKKRLLTVKAEAGGRTAQARLLGQEGEVVWMFLDDGPVALSIKDGSKLADRDTIEQRNPAIRGLIPKNSDYYAYDGGLVITSADARRFRIRGPDSMAEPYTPPNEDSLQQPQIPLARWDPGHPTRMFLVRQMMLDGRWIGFFDEKEAADAANDDFGRKISTGEPGSNPDRVSFETSRARRTFWSARVGKTKEFPEGKHDRLFDVARIAGAPEYLDAGLLIRQGTQQALRLKDPKGFLVLHRTRLDEEGRLAVARLDDNLKTQWTATLPFQELDNRFENPDRLLLYGSLQQTVSGVTGSSEHLVALNLADGKIHSWNVPAEKPD